MCSFRIPELRRYSSWADNWRTALKKQEKPGRLFLFLRCERSLAKEPEGTTYHRISSAAKLSLQRRPYHNANKIIQILPEVVKS